MTNFMHKKYAMFGGVVGFYYCIQFVACVAACNFFSDISRYNSCTMGDVVITGDEASDVFDTAIRLAGVFHVIEWVRATILLTVVCIGVNLMQVWYVTAVTALYGIAVFIYVMVVVGSDKGQACSEAQNTRYMWLIVEIIYFWVFFFINQVPFALTFLFSK